MKFRKLQKIHQGEYLTRYNLHYETKSGQPKQYEMISRRSDLQNEEDLCNSQPDAVVMIIHNPDGDKLLLNHECRMAVGEWVYNFPAGLIDKGESVEVSAARELREETGLHLIHISEVWKESYSAVGFSKEKTVVIVGTADGELQESDSEMEEIEARWFTRQEIGSLLQTAVFAARTQAYCALWCKE